MPRFRSLAQVVESGLGIDPQARLVWFAGGCAVASILQHKDVAANHVDEDAGDGQAVTDIACIAVEHHDCDVRILAATGAANVVGRQLLAIVGGDDQLFKVFDSELCRTRDVGS